MANCFDVLVKSVGKRTVSKTLLLNAIRVRSGRIKIYDDILNPSPVNVTSMSAGADTFTLASHGLANGDKVRFNSVGAAGGIAVNTTYYVVGVSGNDFQVSATYGGSAVNLTYTSGTLPNFLKMSTYVNDAALQYVWNKEAEETVIDTAYSTTLMGTTIGTATEKLLRLPVSHRQGVAVTADEEEQYFKTGDLQSAEQLVTPEAVVTVFGISTTLDELMSLDAEVLCSGSTIASDLQTSTAHGLVTDDQVYLSDLGSVTGTGLAVCTVYFVIRLDANTFSLSLTEGGAAIDLTGANTTPITYRKVIPHTLADGDAVIFSAITGGTGLAINIPYYVISTTTVNDEGRTFKLSLTKGGAAINFSSDVTAGTIAGAGSCDVWGNEQPGQGAVTYKKPMGLAGF